LKAHKKYNVALEKYITNSLTRYNRILSRYTTDIEDKATLLNAIKHCGDSICEYCILQQQMMYISDQNVIRAVCPIAEQVLNQYYFRNKKGVHDTIVSKIDAVFKEFGNEKDGSMQGKKIGKISVNLFQS